MSFTGTVADTSLVCFDQYILMKTQYMVHIVIVWRPDEAQWTSTLLVKGPTSEAVTVCPSWQNPAQRFPTQSGNTCSKTLLSEKVIGYWGQADSTPPKPSSACPFMTRLTNVHYQKRAHLCSRPFRWYRGKVGPGTLQLERSFQFQLSEVIQTYTRTEEKHKLFAICNDYRHY